MTKKQKMAPDMEQFAKWQEEETLEATKEIFAPLYYEALCAPLSSENEERENALYWRLRETGVDF